MPHFNPTVHSAAADAFELTFVAFHYALLGTTKSLKLEARIYSFSPLTTAPTEQRCHAFYATVYLSTDSITRRHSTQASL